MQPPIYYGVDAVSPSQQVMPYLQGQWGCYPSWIARYICGGYVTDTDELAYLAGLGIRVALVYNRFSGSGFPLLDATAGIAHAHEAINTAQALTSGRKALLWRDIESGQQVSAEYLLAWSRTLAAAEWPGGFYGPWAQAAYAMLTNVLLGQVDRLYRLLWSAQWTGYQPPSRQPAFAPQVLVQDRSSLVCWQFAGDVAELNGLVDCSLATAEAYGMMLGAPAPRPPVPVRAAVLQACALKSQPNHTSPALANIPAGGQGLDLGARVQTSGETWAHIQWRDQYGWVLASNLRAVP